MNILELDSYNLDDAVKFNDRLNPRLWDASEHLKPEVRDRLLEIAEDFKEFLGVKDLDLKDITVSGSNAAYTYTPNSDIDLHLVVVMPDNEVYRELFDAKKSQYNDQHNITIGGNDVELYVETSGEPPISQGMYSVLNNEWIQVPRRVKANVDDVSTKNKFETVGHQIERAVKSGDLQRMDRLAKKIKKMRQTGLEAHGEFGPENLAFKILRTQGKIKELYDARNAAKDRELSLKEKAVVKPKVTYGFKNPVVVEADPVTLEDEPAALSDEEILKDFIDFCFKELKLESMPIVKLRKDPQWSVRNKTFGRYIDDHNLLEVAWGQRHIMDVLRTVAHELTHRHQHEREDVPSDAGETGSPYENEANARAGILMRDYARLHPEYFAAGQAEELHSDELDESLKGTAVAALSACIIGGGSLSGCATQQGMRPMDAARVLYNAKQYNSNVLRADVAQELNNFIRAQGGNANAQNQSGLYQIQRRTQNEGYGASTPAGHKILAWQNTPLDGRKYTSQGYTIEFTPTGIEIRQGANLVYRKEGDYSNPTNQHLVKARRMTSILAQGWKSKDLEESASGYIPTKKQAKDPRFSMALTQDIKPGQLGKEANKLNLKTDRQGHPQVANPNGLFEELMSEYKKLKEKKIFALADEDYSPDNPPGPETKPTMPKGTVRVDVSDMYDWYKLGKSISNLKAVDKSQFGKGPPSTIVSFGDEDTEHKYIDDLENLGLSTTDIDPVDPNQPKGMKRQKTDPTYNVAESVEQLDEVKMSPSALMSWAKSPEADGIRAGFEAELIFRDTNSGDDDNEDMEADYDMDERCRSISQVVEFFQDDEYGYGLTERQASRLQDSLDEQYMEWMDQQMYDSWRDERDELIKEAWLREKPMAERIHAALVDGLDLSDEQADAVERLANDREAGKIKGSDMTEEQLDMISQYSEARSIAEDILQEDVEQTIEKEDGFYDEVLDDFRNDFYVDDDSSFFDDVGLRWMSDVSNSYDLGWPYLTGGAGNGGSRDWESIGDSLHSAIDMPVKVSSGYHSATRKEGMWIVEPDSSLDPDDREDYGLEIVSPPMPLLTALDKLQEVTDWANNPGEGNAYTNDSTGLHMGVSVPYKGGDVDYLKLILFLGDEYVLQSFGREANTYTKSAMKSLRDNIKSGRADPAGAMKLMQHGLLELAQKEIQKGVGQSKYTSAHIQNGYIEFRSAGGDWLAEESADPEKLQSTMLRYARAMQLAADPSAERREYAKKLYKMISPESDSQLALFSQFASGELTAEQLKKKWAEKTIGTEKKMNQRWKLYQNIDGRWEPVPGAEWNGYPESEVKNRVWAKYGREALDSGEYQLVNMGEQDWEVYDVNTGKTLEIVKGKSKGEVADAVYDKYVDQGIGFQVRPYEDPSKLTPRAKLAKRITTPKQEPEQTVDTYRGKWEFFYAPTGRVLDAVDDASIMQARAVLADTQRRYNDLPADQIQMRKAGAEQQPAAAQNFNTPQDATQRTGSWAIYDVTLGREISRMDNVPWQQANDRANELERSTGHSMSVRGLTENFADGKNPQDKGDSVRHGIPKGATIAQLEKAAKAPGRKGQLARWQLNMRRGKKK